MSRWGPPGLWVLFTAVAVVSGLVAVALIGQSVTSSSVPVLSAAQVKESLSSAQTPGPSSITGTGRSTATSSPDSGASPSGTSAVSPNDGASSSTGGGPTPSTSTRAAEPSSGEPATSPSPVVARTLTSRGGSVVAECRSGSVYLRSWSPANGYRIDEVSRGPAAEAEIKFENAASEVKLTVRCSSGTPTAEQEVDSSSSDSDRESEDD